MSELCEGRKDPVEREYHILRNHSGSYKFERYGDVWYLYKQNGSANIATTLAKELTEEEMLAHLKLLRS